MVKSMVLQKITGEELKYHFETQPQIAKRLIDKCLNAARAREAARKARETVRKGASLEVVYQVISLLFFERPICF